MESEKGKPSVEIRPLLLSDLNEADGIMRLAFGTHHGLADPLSFAKDAERLKTRFRIQEEGSYAALVNGKLGGSIIAANWGSVAYFGPLSIHPDHWNLGLAKLLLEPVFLDFKRWGTKVACLYTFANSVKHIALYGRYGFHPRFLTALMEKTGTFPEERPGGAVFYSELDEPGRESALKGAKEVCESLFPGLDLGNEIVKNAALNLGEVVMVTGARGVEGFAVCHLGPGTEAPSGTVAVKFAGVREGGDGGRNFSALMAGVHHYAGVKGAARVAVSVNTVHEEAYNFLRDSGYLPSAYGIAMHKPNVEGYSRPGTYVLDDWR